MTDGPASQDPLIGREIDGGRYRVRELIGHGGMASVYLAHQRSVDRLVAIKFIQSRLLIDDNLKKRFHREATVMASITSPHCATVFDFGETDDGLLYIVMEYLQGQSLAGVLRHEGPLSMPVFLEWMSHACAGIHAAHRKGLVHRDLKPENLFVETSPDGRRIKVLDFGLAKILRGDDDPTETQGLTRPGLVFGTPQYMSPEQAMGQIVDARTDVYSLGLVAYECLTGKPAFAGETPQALLIAQATAEPPDVTRLRPDVPEPVRRAIAQALSKSAKARQASADAFYLALSGKEETPDSADADSATIVSPASSSDTQAKNTDHDSLSPAAIGTTPPKTPATTSPVWKVSTALLLLLLGMMWWNSQSKQQTLAPTVPGDQGGHKAQLANADCNEQPPPAYDRRGHPCIDEQTASLWSFDHDYNGRAQGLPPRKMEAAKPEQVTLEPGLSGRAIRFVGDEGSRLTGGGPFSLGDRFTIEAWVKPHTTEPLGCGQFLFGTAQLKGSRQCHAFKIASGWGLIMRKVATGQYELMFHYMHRDLSKGQEDPTQVKLGGPAVLEGNRWNQIAIVSDGQVLSVMVNGRSKDYFRAPRIYEGRGSAYLTFGGYPNHVTGVVEASLDNVRLSDVNRSVSQIRSAYTRLRPNRAETPAP